MALDRYITPSGVGSTVLLRWDGGGLKFVLPYQRTPRYVTPNGVGSTVLLRKGLKFVLPYQRLGDLDISTCDNVPCSVCFNENVSG